MSDEASHAGGSGHVETDRPVSTPEEDLLGRAEFAKKLANTLVGVPGSDPLVVGLYGPWGSGKTSVMNLVRHHLSPMAAAQDVALVDFNPWYFEGEASLLEHFFGELGAALGHVAGGKRAEVVTALRKYARFLVPAERIAQVVGFAVQLSTPGVAGKAIELGQSALQKTRDLVTGAADALDKPPSLADARKELTDALRDAGVRVVVMVDDLDRLYPDDIRTVLKLIRLVGDLPCVSYLVAFDPEVVSRSMDKEVNGASGFGMAFIEKIVQVAVHLPPAETSRLRLLVLQGFIDIIHASRPDVPEDSLKRLVNIWDRSLGRRLRTLRQAKRLLNAARFAVPLLAGEVDLVDVVLLEVLRMWAPTVFDEVRHNPSLVLGERQAGFRDPHRRTRVGEALARIREADASEGEALEVLIKDLFPRVSDNYGSDWEQTWQKQQRVASAEHFSKAVNYGVPSGIVSDIRYGLLVDVLLSDTPTKAKVRAALVRIVESAGWKGLIWRLRADVERFSPSACAVLVSVVAEATNEFSRHDGMMGLLHSFMNAGILIGQALRRCPDPVTAIQDAIASTPSLDFAFELVRVARWPEDDDKPRPEGWEAVEAAARESFVQRVKTTADASWLEPPRSEVVSVLYWWQEIAGKGEVEAAVRQWAAHSPDAIARLVACVITDGWTMETGMPVRGELRRDGYDRLAAVIDPEVIAKLLGADDYPEITREDHYQAKELERLTQARVQFIYMHRLVTARQPDAAPGEEGAHQDKDAPADTETPRASSKMPPVDEE